MHSVIVCHSFPLQFYDTEWLILSHCKNRILILLLFVCPAYIQGCRDLHCLHPIIFHVQPVIQWNPVCIVKWWHDPETRNLNDIEGWEFKDQNITPCYLTNLDNFQKSLSTSWIMYQSMVINPETQSYFWVWDSMP